MYLICATKEWLTPSNKYWFGGSMNFTSSSNNCLKTVNGKIKSYTFRDHFKMNLFKLKMLRSSSDVNGILHVRLQYTIICGSG